jgi:23S rRNA G2069 N7-methylase RlmK/C1962 C5-methylase RlmI
MSAASALLAAWDRREKGGWLARFPALRVFHGPGEGSGALRDVAIERFASAEGDDYWVTAWATSWKEAESDCVEFLRSKGARSAVLVRRPEKGVAESSRKILGEPPESSWVGEGRSRFLIRFEGTRHPGLFLDHEPLRAWLSENARGWRVLNTFAYTGSLSVAAGLGGASHVTTLDLSKPSVNWAKANWEGNGLEASSARFVAGDVFEWLPRLKRSGERFDCVILDPPSFARGNKSSFSTAKDLPRLHELALAILAPGGHLVSSINSANVPRAKFETAVKQAARAAGAKLEMLRSIELPETFPARKPEDRYLKGGIYLSR